MAKLKVFASPQGFFETVVAAPSQKAALEAWGAHQNLFATGMARVTDDAQAVEAALAAPGQVLRRPAGSSDPFRPAGEAALPNIPAPAGKGKSKAARATAAAPKPPPDRRALDAAERALIEAEASHRDRLDDLERQRAELERRMRDVQAQARAAEREFAAASKRLADAVDRASRAYVKAGGRL